MDTIFNVADAKARLSELLERALAGEEIIIAKSGKPLARLVPLAAEPATRSAFFGALAHLGPVPPDALTPEPEDSAFDFDLSEPEATPLRMAAEPAAFGFRVKD